MTMKEELVNYLAKADAQDFTECLREHFAKDAIDDKHFEMISLLYWNDKTHFNALSAGCKASILLFLSMRCK